MKRRDFIIGATGSASSLLLPNSVLAKPCPPSVAGAPAPLCPAGDAEDDWQARISDPGVVWFHDFRTDAEVDQFRWAGGTGNDPGDLGRPNTVRRLTNDGITGSCLEIFRPAGSSDGAVWWRPFSPLDTGNGKPENDPAANDSLSVLPWTPSQGGSEMERWQPGYYGHANYHAGHPGRFDGTEYYFQCRVKMDPRRTGQPDGGKLFYFTRCDRSLTDQENRDGQRPGWQR